MRRRPHPWSYRQSHYRGKNTPPGPEPVSYQFRVAITKEEMEQLDALVHHFHANRSGLVRGLIRHAYLKLKKLKAEEKEAGERLASFHDKPET